MEHRREGSGAGATAWRRAVTHVHFPIVSRPILILQEEREVDKSEKKEKWDELANKKMMGKTEMTGKTGMARARDKPHDREKDNLSPHCAISYLRSVVARRVVESHGKVWLKRLPQLFLPKN